MKNLFATRGDLEPGLADAERSRELRHVSLAGMEGLGISRTGNHLEPSYLVAPRNVAVAARAVPQRKGGVLFALDQMENPSTFVFQPGGIFEQQCLVAGHIGTIHEDPIGKELLQDFSRAVTRGFKKVRSYWVGPEALTLLDSGVRLVTISAKEPSEYDLSR